MFRCFHLYANGIQFEHKRLQLNMGFTILYYNLMKQNINVRYSLGVDRLRVTHLCYEISATTYDKSVGSPIQSIDVQTRSNNYLIICTSKKTNFV